MRGCSARHDTPRAPASVSCTHRGSDCVRHAIPACRHPAPQRVLVRGFRVARTSRGLPAPEKRIQVCSVSLGALGISLLGAYKVPQPRQRPLRVRAAASPGQSSHLSESEQPLLRVRAAASPSRYKPRCGTRMPPSALCTASRARSPRVVSESFRRGAGHSLDPPFRPSPLSALQRPAASSRGRRWALCHDRHRALSAHQRFS